MSDLRLGVHERITVGSRCRRDEVPIEILALFEVVSELAGAGLCSLGQPGGDSRGQSTNGGTSERRECGNKSDIHSSLFRSRPYAITVDSQSLALAIAPLHVR